MTRIRFICPSRDFPTVLRLWLEVMEARRNCVPTTSSIRSQAL